MKIEVIYLLRQNEFEKVLADWATDKNIDYKQVNIDDDNLTETVDGIVIFHENHNFNKETLELHDSLTKHNKLSYKVDINGTLAATSSNFKMWVDRNKAKKLLFLGDNAVAQNENFERFLKHIC